MRDGRSLLELLPKCGPITTLRTTGQSGLSFGHQLERGTTIVDSAANSSCTDHQFKLSTRLREKYFEHLRDATEVAYCSCLLRLGIKEISIDTWPFNPKIIFRNKLLRLLVHDCIASRINGFLGSVDLVRSILSSETLMCVCCVKLYEIKPPG